MTERMEKVAEEMENIINGGTEQETEYFVEKMTTMHKTLNQAFVSSVVIPFVQRMAVNYVHGYYDGRNELACKICADFYEVLKEKYGFQHGVNVRLPLI